MTTDTRTIHVYLDDSRVFSYEVEGAAKAREHAAAIGRNGYFHNDGVNEFEFYGPHRILKVKVTGGPVDTQYPDCVSGT